MKRKILIITPYLIQGGVEHSLITALSQIDYKKNDVTLYLYKNGTDLLPQVPEVVRVIQGIDETHYYRKIHSVILIFLIRLCTLFQFQNHKSKLESLLSSYIHKSKVDYPHKTYFKNTKFDLIISYCLHLGTEITLQIDATKRVLFLHNSHTEYHQDIFEGCFEKLDKIIAVNDVVKQIYINKYPGISDRITVIENYVDAYEIIEKSKQFDVNKCEYKGQYFLCTCGRISKEKGFNLAVDAAEYLKNQGVSFVWLFVGDGDFRTSIEQSIEEKNLDDYVLITGFQDNPYPYIAAADIYIQPSYEEAQPLVLLEAMVLGKSIVSTKTVGGKTILKDGEKGVLTDFNGQAIANGIMTLINSPDVRHSFENIYTLEDNKKEKKIYIEKINQLLSQ